MMNKGYIKILMALILTFIAVSCANDYRAKVGPYDNPDCYGIYFPVQENTGEVIIGLDEPRYLIFKVNRMKTEDAITVPVTIRTDNPEVFSISELRFEEEEPSAELVVYFPSAEPGVTYGCTLLIEDPLYASIYASTPNFVSFNVTRKAR